MEVGSIIPFAGSVVPQYFLLCGGQAISRSVYPELFAVIGTTYGAGDGVTTFNLPAMGGRVAMGGSSSYGIGTSGGYRQATLQTSSIPSHSHTAPQHGHASTTTVTTGTLTHSVSSQAVLTIDTIQSRYSSLTALIGGIGSTGIIDPDGSTSYDYMTLDAGMELADHPATAVTMSGGVISSPSENTEGAGASTAMHNNMMPYMALNYIIMALPIPVPSMVLYNGHLPVTAGNGYICGSR